MVSEIKVTTLRLKPEIKARAQALAARRSMSLTGLIGFLLGEYLDTHSAIVIEPLAQKAAKGLVARSQGPSRQQRRAQERATAKESR